MKKVKEIIPPILNTIKDRPWIFIGYSGDDPIFEQIVKLGRFDQGLYWVTYKDHDPSEKVINNLLEKDNTNSFLIKGYDADSFLIHLSNELKLEQPSIIDKPFTALQTSLENIVDIEDGEHFKAVKERLEIVKSQVNTAIKQFEDGEVTEQKALNNKIQIDILKKKIIDTIAKEEFSDEEIKFFDKETKEINNSETNRLLSDLYSNYGTMILNSAREKNDETLFRQSFEKYEQATILNEKNDSAFYNWGTALSNLAKLKNDETLFRQSFEKYEQATILNEKNDSTFNNWGTALSNLAKLKNDETLFKQSFEKYEQATILNEKDDSAFYNWGTALSNLAKLKNDENLFRQSFEKLHQAVELGGSSYNLSCAYALNKDKENALNYLEISFKKNDISVDFVENDGDWAIYKNDSEFMSLLDEYRN